MPFSGISVIDRSSTTLTLACDNDAGMLTILAAEDENFTIGVITLYASGAPANYQAEFGPLPQATTFYLRAREGSGAWCQTVISGTNGFTTFTAETGNSGGISLTISVLCDSTITIEIADNDLYQNATEVYSGAPVSSMNVPVEESGSRRYFRAKVDNEASWIAFADAVAANSVSSLEITVIGIHRLTAEWATAASYSIVQISEDGEFWTTVYNGSVTGGHGSVVITNLSAATLYTLRVADEAVEPYDWSPAAQASTAEVFYDGEPGLTSIALELRSTVAGLTYRIERWDFDEEEWIDPPISSGQTTTQTQTFTITGLAMGLDVKTRAVIVEDGVDAWDTELDHTIRGVTDLAAVASSHTAIDLTWTNHGHDTVYGVRLYRATNAQFTDESEIHRWTTTDPEEYADTGLTQGTTYHYRIYLAAGVTSAPASASTLGISGLAAVATSRTAATVAFNTTETVATVEVNSQVVETLSGLTPGPQSVPITGLTAGTLYTIRVMDTGPWVSTTCRTWGVYDVELVAVDHDSLELTFSTAKPNATCVVEYSPNDGFWPVFEVYNGTIEGTLVQPINGLEPRTEYWVRVTDDGTNWVVQSKATYPAPISMGPGPVTIDFGVATVSDEVPQARFLAITCDDQPVYGTAADWSLAGILVVEAAAASLPVASVQGKGLLRWDSTTTTLAWKAPGDAAYGTAWRAGAAYEGVLVLPSDDQEKWLAIQAYEGYLPENSETAHVSISEQWAGAWGFEDVTAAQALAGLVDEYEWTLTNVSGEAISNLNVWLADESPGFLELSDDGQAWVSPIEGSPLALADLGADEAISLFLRRTIPAETAASAAVRNLIRFSADVPNLTSGIEMESRIFYRILGEASVRLYAEPSEPQYNDTPIAVVPELPATPDVVFEDGTYYLSAAVDNGVIVGALAVSTIMSIVDGQVFLQPPLKPHSSSLTLDEGLPKVSAAYSEEYPYRAHEWAIAYTTDGSTPAANNPDVTASMGFSGTAILVSTLPAVVTGTTVKVRVQVRRNDGTAEEPVWTYSVGETVLELLVTLIAPTAAIGGRALAHGQEA